MQGRLARGGMSPAWKNLISKTNLLYSPYSLYSTAVTVLLYSHAGSSLPHFSQILFFVKTIL